MADDTGVAPELTEADLRAIDAAGTRRRTTAGEYLFRQGDATYDFFTVLSGAVDIVVEGGDGESLIIRHGPRRFLGELNLLSGRRLSVSARVAEDGEVIVVPRDQLRA